MSVRSVAAVMVASSCLVVGAQAADLIIPTTPEPMYEAAGFDWEGLYAGAELGGVFNNFGVGSLPSNVTQGVVGGIIGVNFMVADPLLLGLEAQADYVWGSGGDAGLFLAMAHVGAVVTDRVLVYAAGGVGFQTMSGFDNSGVYALGGGVEVALTDSVTVRGEILGLGDFSGPFSGGDFFESTKATVGIFYHF